MKVLCFYLILDFNGFRTVSASLYISTVDFKNVDVGDKVCFQPNFRFDTTIPMNTPIVRFNSAL